MLSSTASSSAASRATAREHMAAALAKAPAKLSRIAVSAPVAEPTALPRALPSLFACCWLPAEGLHGSGLGVAREVVVRGHGRLLDLRLRARRLFAELETFSTPGLEIPPPRLFGGLAFAAGADHGPLWQGFGDGRFVLPRWSYGVRGKHAFLSLMIDPEKELGAAELLRQLEVIWEALERPPARAAESESGDQAQARHLDPGLWNRRVKEIRARIQDSGTLRKIVTARTTRIDPAEAFDELEVLGHLSELYPGCNRFLFRHGGASFLGASPEILFAKRGPSLTTQALAGSVRIHPDLSVAEAGEALLGSRKNLEEHAVVVREIGALLAPLSEEVEHPERPRVMRLRDLLHLETPMHARLRPETDVLDLLKALHPTPAVAGWPRQEAMDWIAAHEGEPRGWFTGPVGWLDAVGDGTMAVAIRSGLVEKDRAHAFAGAGIMHDSDPPMEYGETAVKLKAMLRALGATPRQR